MKDTELKQLRDKDLYEKYVQCLREKNFVSMDEAANYARTQPARRFYISPRSAAHLIRVLETTGRLEGIHGTSKRRILCIYQMYKAYIQMHPDMEKAKERIMEELVEREAPEFFLSLGRAKHIIMYERNKVRKKKW